MGSLVDLGVLWLGQRQPGVQWEFVAVTNTAQAWPRFVMGVAFAYLGAHVGSKSADWVFRSLGGLTLLLGVGAAALGGLAALNTVTMLNGVTGQGSAMIKVASAKTLILCALYVILLVPLGIMGLRGPKS